ncbi:MAG: hypothetical protein GY716_22425 [bacterium]|nr:hypothetical protein [bacterium]
MRQPVILGVFLLLLIAPGAAAQNEPPEAEDDLYATSPGDNLSVDFEDGVLVNDTDADDDPLTAILVDDPVSGGVANLFPDGSFEYEPPDGFVGTDSFTYRAFDGTDTSNLATVEVDVEGTPGFSVYVDETAFLNALAALGLDATVESFEDDVIWGGVRSTIVGGNFTAPFVDSLGVRWMGNNPDSEVTTSTGPPRSGQWGFYELPHGSYLTGVDCHLPGNCTDGFVGVSSPTLYAVGGWLEGFHGSKIRFVLDGDRIGNFGDDAIVGNIHEFFGVVDPAGFHSFEVQELEGTNDDAKYIWADDFTFGTPSGITLSALRGADPGDVVLQWLGGQPDFAVYRSADPATLLNPANELGQSSDRHWTDPLPPGQLLFYRVVIP